MRKPSATISTTHHQVFIVQDTTSKMSFSEGSAQGAGGAAHQSRFFMHSSLNSNPLRISLVGQALRREDERFVGPQAKDLAKKSACEAGELRRTL